MYPVNSCSPIRLKTEAPIAQLLGLKEYKRRVAKNNYVHYWFSRLVHIFLAMQCKEDFFKMAFLMQSVLQKTGKNQQKSELITGDTNWKHLPKSSQTFCWSKYSVDPSNFPKGILTQHGTGYKSLREQYFWSLSGEKKCLHYPFKASWSLKPQDPNRKHSQTFFFLFFCLHAAHVWYTPHPTDAIFHAAMLVDCRQMTRKLKNMCASSACKTSSSLIRFQEDWLSWKSLLLEGGPF